MDLIENMICFDPAYRLTLMAVRNHPWLDYEEATEEEVAEELAKRRDKVEKVSTKKKFNIDEVMLRRLSYIMDLKKLKSMGTKDFDK